jgi:hypothetical protein
MINQAVAPINRIEQLNNFQDAIQSRDALDRLRAMQGLVALPQIQRKGGGSIPQTAKKLQDFGRYGDSLLVHMHPTELEGLASLGRITVNPVTGLPEAWNPLRTIRKITRSKAFKTLAPIVIGLVAPQVLGMTGASLFSGYGAGLTGAAKYGLASAIGGGLGALAAGKRGSDVTKSALISGLVGGGMRYGSNLMQQKALANAIEADKAAKAAEAAKSAQAGQTILESSGTAYDPNVMFPAQSSSLGRVKNIPFGDLPENVIQPDNQLLSYTGGRPEFYGTFPKSEQPLSGTLDPSSWQQAGQIIRTDPNQLAQFAGGAKTTPMLQEMTRKANMSMTEGLVDQAMRYDPATGQTSFSPLKTLGSVAKGMAPGELASTYLDIEQAEEDAEEQAKQQLAQMDYEIDTGFGGQTVIRDPSGVVLPAYLSPQDILNIALGRTVRPRYVAGTTFAPTREAMGAAHGGGIGSIIYRQDSGKTTVDFDSTNPEHMNLLDKTQRGEMSREDFYDTFNMWPDQIIGDMNEASPPHIDIDEGEEFKDVQNIKTGGPIRMARGGEFSGMVPGQGHGMEDNVYMPIKEGPKQIGTLAVSPREYVVDAHTMAAIGNGNPTEGARVMDGVVENVRKRAYGSIQQPNEINGLQALAPMMRGV